MSVEQHPLIFNPNEEIKRIQSENADSDMKEIATDGVSTVIGEPFRAYDRLSSTQHPLPFASDPLSNEQKKEFDGAKTALLSRYGERFLEVLAAWQAAEWSRKNSPHVDDHRIVFSEASVLREENGPQLSLEIG